jgi:hypothetical protein
MVTRVLRSFPKAEIVLSSLSAKMMVVAKLQHTPP